MIELMIRMLGCGKIITTIDALDGMKQYIAGTCKMLTGLAAILTALASFLPHLATGKGLSGAIAVFTGPDFPIAKAAIVGGWWALLDGFHAIGKAHAAEKAALAASAAAQVSPGAPPAAGPVAP